MRKKDQRMKPIMLLNKTGRDNKTKYNTTIKSVEIKGLRLVSEKLILLEFALRMWNWSHIIVYVSYSSSIIEGVWDWE